MKKIVKQSQPTELQKWRATNTAVPENFRYGCGGFPTNAVLKSLLTEQGFLCAYTLMRVSSHNAHIEHLKPQSRCINGEDVSWDNMVACFPQPGAQHPGFGAVQKESWWEVKLFISPLAENCESRFRYKGDGSIEAAIEGDSAAGTTIEKLKLDCGRLREARRNAIMNAGLHKRAPNPMMSESKVRAFVQTLSQQQAYGFTEFCTVLEQVAIEYIQVLKKHAKRKRCASTRGGR
ncbi:retron system putative HNH endonuclease [Desulfobacter sp. UBA2225]|uniref:retron system putative HNH endonuclease n=1 Tax=Desulfobacter sp. UBA2225 TaxID=1961413 RepID=UPI0025797207|nr:retron system putative HNH endonuclease [Desulfobacter sp. UBA2225]